jgi:hypothetical protein
MEILLIILGFTLLIGLGGAYAASKAPPTEQACARMPKYCCQCGRKMTEPLAGTESGPTSQGF